MKIAFSAPIRDLKGRELDEAGAEWKEGAEKMTLGGVATTALLTQRRGEENLAGTVKVKRFSLALAIVDGGEQELTVEDVAELKRLIGETFPPLIVGRAFEIIGE